METLEEGDLVICTVDRIAGTVVFVKLEDGGEGSIVLSEIAPGRIRNLREYVVPKKRIVCKVLRITDSGNLELSLRRVSQKEKKEMFEKEQLEKSCLSIIKNVVKRDYNEILSKIKNEMGIVNFFEEIKKDPELIKKYFSEEESAKILTCLKDNKPKNRIIKEEISLFSTKPDGVLLIKKILSKLKDVNIKYIAAGRYLLEIEAENLKEADKKLKNYILEIGKEAKKEGMEFSHKS